VKKLGIWMASNKAQVINLFFVEGADFLDFGEYTGNNNGVECSAHFKKKNSSL
jgi:hypothetical protein